MATTIRELIASYRVLTHDIPGTIRFELNATSDGYVARLYVCCADDVIARAPLRSLIQRSEQVAIDDLANSVEAALTKRIGQLNSALTALTGA